VPLQVGALKNDVWGAIEKKLDKSIDAKLSATTLDFAHMVRIQKVNKIPAKHYGAIYDAIENPKIVYAEKSEILFFAQIGKTESVRVAFGHKSRMMRLQSASYFDDDEVTNQTKRKVKLYEKN
jgi:hypothetical protein